MTIPGVPSLSVNQYHGLIDAGVLKEGEPIELLEGALVKKMTIEPPDRIATKLLRTALQRLLPEGWYEDAGPITTSDSEPEPDIVVARGNPRDYDLGHPGPKDLALVVEISASSLLEDQTVKQRLYARAGIAVYWIVNLINRCVEVYTDPTGSCDAPTYCVVTKFGPSDQVPVLIEGQEAGRIAVADILP